MVHKLHLLTIVTVISLITGITQIPTAFENNILLAQKAAGISALSVLNSAIITCEYDPNISESTTDGGRTILSSTPVGFIPALSVLDNSGKTVQSYDLIPTFKCSPKNNSQKFVTSNSFSGSVLVYVIITDSNGNIKKVFGQTVSVSAQNVPFSSTVNVGRISIPASTINQYYSVLGTSGLKFEIFTQPNVSIASNFDPTAGLGNSQVSSWTTWTDYPTNIQIQNLGSGGITVNSAACQLGQTVGANGKCTVPSGTSVSSADVKFFYQLAYVGVDGIFCGANTSTPTAGNPCLVSSTSSPTVSLTSLQFLPSNAISTHSLNSFTVQLVLYPKDTSLNLDSGNIGYTGTILYQDAVKSKTISIPASLIPVTQQASRLADGSFVFGKASIDPAKLDSLILANGLTTGNAAVPVTVTIYATGNFQGHGANGNFQGAVNQASFQINTFYTSTALQGDPNSCTLTNAACNKNTCHDLSGNVISCYIPPATNNSTGNLCFLNPFDSSCASANPPNSPPPTCDQTGTCTNPPNPTNPPSNPQCFGACSVNTALTTQQTQTPTSTSQQSNNAPSGGQFFPAGTPTASATPTGASICPSTMTASDCANYLYGLVNVNTLNQNILVVIIVGAIAVIVTAVIIIRRRKGQ